jgi:hypothetical protein
LEFRLCDTISPNCRRNWSSFMCKLFTYVAALAFLSAQLLGAQTPSQSPFQLLVRSPVRALEYVSTKWSADGRYFLLYPSFPTPGDSAILYDLAAGVEIKRLDASKIGDVGSNLWFANLTPDIYLNFEDKVLRCPLDGVSDCTVVVNEEHAGFAISADDRMAYMNLQRQIVVSGSKGIGAPQLFLMNNPYSEEESSDPSITLLSQGGRATQVAVSLDASGAPEGATAKNEAYVATFDLSACQTPGTACLARRTFTDLPITNTQPAFSSDGRVFVCGLRKADAKLPIADRHYVFYNVASHNVVAQAALPADLVEAARPCYEPKGQGDVRIGLSLGVPTVAGHPINTWHSPKGNRTVYSMLDKSSGIMALYTQVEPAGKSGHPVLLAGITDSTAGYMEYVLRGPMILTESSGTKFWNLNNGLVTPSPGSPLFSSNRFGDVAEFAKGQAAWSMATIARDSFQAVTRNLTLSGAPEWFGIAADGGTVAYLTGFALLDEAVSVYANGKSTALSCKMTGEFASLRPKPSIDSTGTLLTAFCDRKVPGAADAELEMVTWKIQPATAPAQEICALPVGKYDPWFSVGTDLETAVLGDWQTSQLVDLKTCTATKLELPKRSGDEPLGGELQRDNHTIIVAFNSISAGAYVEKFDLVTGKNTIFTPRLSRITHISTDLQGKSAVLDHEGVVHLFTESGQRWMRLVSAGEYDWLALGEDGLFDGTWLALRYASLRVSTTLPTVNMERLFSELYTPGLLAMANSGVAPPVPAVGMATYLELPNLRQMLRRGLTPMLIGGKAVVCSGDHSALDGLPGAGGDGKVVVNAAAGCPFAFVLQDQRAPQQLVQALMQLKAFRVTTPWDGKKMNSAPGKVHYLPIAVSQYAANGLPVVPTAVSSVQSLQSAVAKGWPADKVKVWDATSCGATLTNASATKDNLWRCLIGIAQVAGPDDMVVLALAGHGGTPTGTGASGLFSFYLAGYVEGKSTEDDSVSVAYLADWIRGLRVRRLVIVMDACDSGSALQPLEGAAKAMAAASMSTGGTGSTPSGVLLITAADGDVTSGETINPFMDKLIASLNNATQGIWASDLAVTMSTEIELPASVGGGKMQPTARLIGADFPLSQPATN